MLPHEVSLQIRVKQKHTFWDACCAESFPNRRRMFLSHGSCNGKCPTRGLRVLKNTRMRIKPFLGEISFPITWKSEHLAKESLPNLPAYDAANAMGQNWSNRVTLSWKENLIYYILNATAVGVLAGPKIMLLLRLRTIYLSLKEKINIHRPNFTLNKESGPNGCNRLVPYKHRIEWSKKPF